jgi:hypothetical protein
MMVAVALVSSRRYGWLPPLFVVWSNCHGGVILGLVIVAAGLMPAVLRCPHQRRAICATLVACIAATFVTPLGWRFWVYIPESLGRISLYPLDEWRRTPLLELTVIPFWLIAALFSGTLIRRCLLARASLPKCNETLCASALILLPASILAIRNVGPFLMIAVPALTTMLAADEGKTADRREPRAVNVVLLATLGSLVAATLLWAYHAPAAKLKWRPISDGAVAAIGSCPGNLYNRYDEGGYLLWFAPTRKVFMDGRQDPFTSELVLEHIRMETVGGDTDRVFARHHIGCAYLPSSSPTAAHLVASGWAKRFDSDGWLVLARQ